MESSQQELNVPLHRATSQEALHELVADGSKGDVQQHTRDEFASAPESPLETRSTLVSTATADAASQTDPVMLTGEDRAGAQAVSVNARGLPQKVRLAMGKGFFIGHSACCCSNLYHMAVV